VDGFHPRGVFIDTVSFAFEGNGKPGPVTGKVTFRGVVCGAQDEPLKGAREKVLPVRRYRSRYRRDPDAGVIFAVRSLSQPQVHL
jgi:hypothetical protein